MPEIVTSPPTSLPASVPAMKGERRVITVLFADVVNSTGLAETLDPEDWTEIMNAAFPVLTAPIRRYEGTVARLMGDGLLAFFGAPLSHEDDPKRAVLAALDMQQAVSNFAKGVNRQHGLDFAVRIGINTGPVVIGDVGSAASMEYTAMGDAVNVAARMQSTAEPGTVRLAGDTYRLVAPFFEVMPLGQIDLKGKSEPVAAYRVTGERKQSILQRGADGVSSPLIGRAAELEQLKGAVDRLREGRGQIVSIIGEAGLGKSRLISEIKQYWATREDPARFEEMSGVPYDTSRPFGLFQNFARRMFGIEFDDSSEVIDRKVRAQLDPRNEHPQQVGLCSIAMQRVIAVKALDDAGLYSAEAVRQDIHEIVEPAFRANSRDAPTVVVMDDLQWADPASTELVLSLLDLADEVPLLFICAFRPERQSPAWQIKLRAETDFPHRYSEITLKPLNEDDTNALITALLMITDLPDELRALILRKTDGNPYFVEEVVRTLIDQGLVVRSDAGLAWKAGTQIAEIAIPDTLQALLMARIDRLSADARSTLQMASVIGRSFYYRILRAISDSAMAIDSDLRALERVELLRESGRNPELEYIFKHELARDAAYATILNRRRKEFHLRVAAAMESLFSDRPEEQAHRMAQHFELGGDSEKAMRYFSMAGEAAAGINARSEGLSHFGRAIDAARRFGAPTEQIGAIEARRAALEAAR